MNKQTEARSSVDTALKMAIEFMDLVEQYASNDELRVDNHKLNTLMSNALQACKEALEQPAQKPWGWYENHDIYDEKQSDDSIALYTHPCVLTHSAPSNGMDKKVWARVVPWQGLSEQEVKEIIENLNSPYAQIRTAELTLKEKNNV